MKRCLFTILSAVFLSLFAATVGLAIWSGPTEHWHTWGHRASGGKNALDLCSSSDQLRANLYWRLPEPPHWAGDRNPVKIYRLGILLYASSGDQGGKYCRLTVAYPLPLTLFGVLGILFAGMRFLARQRYPAGRCPACGYDLRATPDRCPECGAVPAGAGK